MIRVVLSQVNMHNFSSIDQGFLHGVRPLVGVDLIATESGIEVYLRNELIGKIVRIGPEKYRFDGMDYDRLYMAIRDMIRKHKKDQER